MIGTLIDFFYKCTLSIFKKHTKHEIKHAVISTWIEDVYKINQLQCILSKRTIKSLGWK
jgi:ribosomal protein L23